MRDGRNCIKAVECGEGDSLERHGADARLGLRAPEPALAEATADVGDSRVPIDVALLERDPFPRSHSGGRGASKRRKLCGRCSRGRSSGGSSAVASARAGSGARRPSRGSAPCLSRLSPSPPRSSSATSIGTRESPMLEINPAKQASQQVALLTRQPSRPRARPRRRRSRRTRAGTNARSQATDPRLTTTTLRAVACFVIRQQPAGTRRVHQTGHSRVCAGPSHRVGVLDGFLCLPKRVRG